MRPKSTIITFFLISIAVLFIAVGTNAQTVPMADVTVPDEWAGTYTSAELAAIDRALWAANLTREDLEFRKDYTEGYGCFPIVLDWMESPLDIAPGMDAMVAGFEREEGMPSPYAEVVGCLEYFPGEESEIIETVALDVPTDPGSLEEFCRTLAEADVPMNFDSDDELQIIRQYAPYQLAWHDVFESPYAEEQVEAWDEFLEDKPDSYLFDLMTGSDTFANAAALVSLCPDPREWLTDVPDSAFPTDEPVVIDTENGRIAIGTFGDDTYEGDFTVLIDPGGNDHYVNCRIGAAYGTENRRYGYFADLGGDDFYDCGDVNITLGAAILGVAAFYDLGQGNDRYVAGSCTLGAAMCGVATFYDDGGSDTYEGKVYSQGAAGFGIGVMLDDSVHDAPVVPTDEETPDPIDIGAFDNDHYYAWTNSQAFARTLGFAVCSNERGNEIYEAGGVYLHAPLFADRYQSFSQGFAIGARGIDYAGGIALIVDYDGNDRYLGDIYNQGVGYWYSAGLVYDGAGNDMYEMTQYGQGSGIHLAVGGLVDVSGSDSYTMHAGLGTGGSHDYAASMLHDRDGNDQYFGNTSCNGGSLTNSAVVFIDRAGNDTYAGRRSGGINFGRPARGFMSIGVLVDLEGEDDYLGIMDNGELWRHTNVGVGWDIIPPPPPEDAGPAPEAERGGLGEDVPLPEVISYEGELTREVFDELWEISVRWEVGDNRYIVPKARDRLIEFGPEVLPYISAEFDNMVGGLAIRAFDYILGALVETDREAVVEMVRENISSGEEMRVRVALAEISTLKLTELEGEVAALLDDPDPQMQRRAIGVLGAIESHVADEQLLQNLSAYDDEALIKVSMEALFALDVFCWEELRPLLDYPYISVRDTLIRKLVGNADTYDYSLVRELAEASGTTNRDEVTPALSTRALRSVLDFFARAEVDPDPGVIDSVSVLLHHEDWGVRADAVRVAYHWDDLARERLATSGDPSYAMQLLDIIEPLLREVEEVLEDETDPYVLFVGMRE